MSVMPKLGGTGIGKRIKFTKFTPKEAADEDDNVSKGVNFNVSLQVPLGAA